MDERLTLLAQMVKPCKCAADIGTDHGYLICALVGSGVAERGIAADINPQPLGKAIRQIAACGLTDRVTPHCADGLNGIGQEVDAVIAAGMGGETIAGIVDGWQYSRRPGVSFYLQPMTKAERLREYLYSNGFSIVTERCCVAARRHYSVMEVAFTGSARDFTPLELWLGKIDPTDGEDEKVYCTRLLAKLQKKLDGLTKANAPQAQLDYWQDLCAKLQNICENNIREV